MAIETQYYEIWYNRNIAGYAEVIGENPEAMKRLSNPMNIDCFAKEISQKEFISKTLELRASEFEIPE